MYIDNGLTMEEASGTLYLTCMIVLSILGCVAKCAKIGDRLAEERNLQEHQSRIEEGRQARIAEVVEWQQQQQHSPQVDIEIGQNHPPAQSISELSKVFSQALETKKQETKLAPSDICEAQQDDGLVPQDEAKNNEKEVHSLYDYIKDFDPFSWALASARTSCQSERRINLSTHFAKESKNDYDSDGDDSSIIVKNETSTFRSGLWFFHPRNKKKLVGANCAICLDDMQPGEWVVWSETKSCPHMFHKECLVKFLAHNQQAQMRLPSHQRQLDRHPCPTCRQQFVTTTTTTTCPVVPCIATA